MKDYREEKKFVNAYAKENNLKFEFYSPSRSIKFDTIDEAIDYLNTEYAEVLLDTLNDTLKPSDIGIEMEDGDFQDIYDEKRFNSYVVGKTEAAINGYIDELYTNIHNFLNQSEYSDYLDFLQNTCHVDVVDDITDLAEASDYEFTISLVK